MGINTHVTSRPTKALAFTVGYVLLSLWISPELSHAKVDDTGAGSSV